MNDVYERLRAACRSESEDAGIEILGEYAPVGRGGKVMPPTYPVDAGSTPYVIEQRLINGEVRDVVLLDSVPSEANRIEAELNGLAEFAELPIVRLSFTVGHAPETETAVVTSWTAPHRHADAYFEHSLCGDKPFPSSREGRAILAALPTSAEALYHWFPGSLIFGAWTARKKGQQARFPRVYTSEIVGYSPVVGARRAGRMDPLNLQQPTDGKLASSLGKKRLSEVGLGNIAPVEQHGGVTVERVVRSAWLSLTGLRRLSFGGGAERDAAACAALAALALWGDRLAFAGASLWLRSGCELLPLKESLLWRGPGERNESLDLNVVAAKELFVKARDEAVAAGIVMERGILELTPQDDLQRAVEFTLMRAEGVDEA